MNYEDNGARKVCSYNWVLGCIECRSCNSPDEMLEGEYLAFGELEWKGGEVK